MSQNLLRLAGSILLIVFVSCSSSENSSVSEEAHLQMYHNGKILDKYKSERIDRDCLVLKNGRAVFKGDIEYAQAEYAGAEKIDLKGRSLIYTEINGPADFNQDIDSQVAEIPLYEKANYALIYTDEEGAHTVEKIVKDGSTQYKKPGPTPEEIATQKAIEQEEARLAALKAEEEEKLAAAKAEEEARLAALKAEEEEKFAAAKAEEEARLAALKAEEEEKLAAAKAAKEQLMADQKVLEETRLKAINTRNVIVINCRSKVPNEANLENKSLILSAKLMVKKGKELPFTLVSAREVDNFDHNSEYTVEYHNKQAFSEFTYNMNIELKELGNDSIIYSSSVPLSCSEDGKIDQDFVDVVLESSP